LIAVLSSDRRDAFLIDLLRSDRLELAERFPTIRILNFVSEPWSVALSRAVLDHLGKHDAKKNAQLFWTMHSMLKEFALRIDPSVVDYAASILSFDSQTRSTTLNKVDEFLDIVRFRQEILKEVNP